MKGCAMKNKEEILNVIKKMDEKVLNDISVILKRHQYNTTNLLAHIVASVCDIDVTDIFTVSHKAYLSQSRWLFWYAYRYMTNETYEHIAEKTMFEGHKFHQQAIVHGITCFAKLIEYDKTWANKWHVVKRFVNTTKEHGNNEELKHQVTISVPKNLDVIIKKQ